jgi:hypothetical protein
MPVTLDPAWALICMDQWRSDCAIRSGPNSALNSYAKVWRLCATRSEGQRSDFSQPRTAGNVRSLGALLCLGSEDSNRPRDWKWSRYPLILSQTAPTQTALSSVWHVLRASSFLVATQEQARSIPPSCFRVFPTSSLTRQDRISSSDRV